jgi:hypothetical protein
MQPPLELVLPETPSIRMPSKLDEMTGPVRRRSATCSDLNRCVATASEIGIAR